MNYLLVQNKDFKFSCEKKDLAMHINLEMDRPMLKDPINVGFEEDK